MIAGTRTLGTLALCALALAASARADELLLRNGDRLTGKVTKRAEGKVYFHSDVFGDIVAPANLVTVVEGTPPPTPPESLAGLPPQPKVATLTPPAGGAPAPTSPPPSPPAPPPRPPVGPAAAPRTPPAPEQPVALAPARSRPWIVRPLGLLAKPLEILSVFKPWSGKVEFGYDNELTNVRTVSTNLRAEVDRTSGPDDFMADLKYLNGFSANQATTDQTNADFRWRHHLNERLFTQSLSSYSRDKIRELHEDLDENAGLGYKVFEGPRQTVDVGAGVIGQYLDVGGFQKGYDVLGSVFEDYTYKINGRFTFLQDVSAQYSPQERARFGLANGQTALVSGRTQNYNYKFNATLQGKLNERLSLNLHFEYQYYSTILDKNARGDQHITTTLGYAF